jgi:intracellular septation protein
MNQKVHPIFSQKIFSHIIASSLLEFGPVILFLVSYRFLRIYESTMLLMIATIVSTIITYRIQKRIPYLALYVAFITIVFGFLTLHFHKVKFIQMRDSLYDATCALTLFLGIRFNISFLSLAFDRVLPMTARAWDKLTYLWITYFLIIAASNEIARRFLSIGDWLVFKGFILIMTSCFGFFSLYISYEAKHKKVA